MRTRYWNEILVAAKIHQLDPTLVEAVVVQESSGNTDAFRFEPNFYNRYIKPKGLFPGQNPRRVSSSYGLMQLMYPVAVELGYKEPPEKLFQPETGLYWGCVKLRALTDWAATFPLATPLQRTTAVLAAYNGGMGDNKPTQSIPLRNQSYATQVLAKLSILVKEHAPVKSV